MNFDENPEHMLGTDLRKLGKSDISGWKCLTEVGNVSFFLLC